MITYQNYMIQQQQQGLKLPPIHNIIAQPDITRTVDDVDLELIVVDRHCVRRLKNVHKHCGKNVKTVEITLTFYYYYYYYHMKLSTYTTHLYHTKEKES